MVKGRIGRGNSAGCRAEGCPQGVVAQEDVLVDGEAAAANQRLRIQMAHLTQERPGIDADGRFSALGGRTAQQCAEHSILACQKLLHQGEVVDDDRGGTQVVAVGGCGDIGGSSAIGTDRSSVTRAATCGSWDRASVDTGAGAAVRLGGCEPLMVALGAGTETAGACRSGSTKSGGNSMCGSVRSRTRPRRFGWASLALEAGEAARGGYKRARS